MFARVIAILAVSLSCSLPLTAHACGDFFPNDATAAHIAHAQAAPVRHAFARRQIRAMRRLRLAGLRPLPARHFLVAHPREWWTSTTPEAYR